MKYGLTKRQAALLKFIQDYRAKHGVSPTYQEMKDHLRLGSRSVVHAVIGQLEERGYIIRLSHRPRSVMPVDERVAPCG